MQRKTMNSLTAFFADLGDIRHEAEFVIFDTGALQPGTRIVSSAPDAKGSHLEIITDKGQGI